MWPKGKLEDGLHMACRLGGVNAQALVVYWYWFMRDELPDACRCQVTSMLKGLTRLAKLGGEYLYRDWRWLVYWEVGLGFQPYCSVDKMEGKARKWLEAKVALGGPMGEDRYTRAMYVEARKFLSEEWVTPSETPSVIEYCKGGAWMMGRAGMGASTEVYVEGKKFKSRRNKGVDGVTFSDEDVASRMFISHRDEMHVMQKSEPTKIRPVVKCGNDVNRQMGYLSTAVERELYGSKSSTLFAGAKGDETIDLRLVDMARDPSGWKVPLDQSGFDSHQSKPTIMAILAAISSRT